MNHGHGLVFKRDFKTKGEKNGWTVEVLTEEFGNHLTSINKDTFFLLLLINAQDPSPILLNMGL
jgi:hypothetical protein